MTDQTITDVVQAAIKGNYDIPEFQREFIWKPGQVAALAESLSLGYPVGCLVVWKSTDKDGKERIYVVDGQQRITALCIMFGKQPYWKDIKEWQVISATYTPNLSVSSEGKFFFG
ncbi:MAG: DUF262 domain-containing protein [Chloroflexi bacterium]|nr:DUF262 domain-containing protein [Chloroflexota bacterium]